MEELLKFVTAEQSRRSEAFVFFWRIIMAISLSNKFMEKIGYHFVNNEIKLNTVIDFIFSQSFIYASIFYLLFIFLFFGAFKILSFVLRDIVFCRLKPMSSENLNKVFLLLGYFKLGETNQVHIINRKTYDDLRIIATEAINWIGSDSRDKLYSYVNVLFSTYFFWVCCANALFDFPFFVDKLLLITVIILVVIILSLDIVIIPLSSLQQHLLVLKRNPFYEEIHP